MAGGVPEDALASYLHSHLIDPRHLWSDHFDAYFNTRRSALLDKIGAAMGKPISDGIEEHDDAPSDYELVQQDSLVLSPADESMFTVAGSML